MTSFTANVHRLKLLKRQGYGRAGFALLRRVFCQRPRRGGWLTASDEDPECPEVVWGGRRETAVHETSGTCATSHVRACYTRGLSARYACNDTRTILEYSELSRVEFLNAYLNPKSVV